MFPYFKIWISLEFRSTKIFVVIPEREGEDLRTEVNIYKRNSLEKKKKKRVT